MAHRHRDGGQDPRSLEQLSGGLTRRQMLALTGGLVGAITVGGVPGTAQAAERGGGRTRGAGGRQWLAGDHHVHSQYSTGYDRTTNPPTPLVGGDGIYPIPLNAQKARSFGCGWMVSTDHGGPNHSKVNRDLAYPELLQSRRDVPEVLQFYGMEFDTPAADHSSLIIPKVANERDILFALESAFSKRDAFPTDPGRDTEPKMLEALRAMRQYQDKPVLFANHPSRSATGLGVYGLDTPSEFRNWNDTAPEVATGFEGAPGHQAGGLNPDGSLDPNGARGGYGRYPTMGGFDQMTARLGGLWDSLLGEGRRWWISATSDSHRNYVDGGSDFWPGEYSKTYVHAASDYADILDGIRNGRMFVTLGDLVDRVELTARRATPGRGEPQGPPNSAAVGETLVLRGNAERSVDVEVRIRQPRTPNVNGDRPSLKRVDVITGRITGPVADRSSDTNPTTTVAERFGPGDWRVEDGWIVVRHRISDVDGPMYIRVRGTSTDELEPLPDPRGEDPWSDLWFYSNPVFLQR